MTEEAYNNFDASSCLQYAVAKEARSVALMGRILILSMGVLALLGNLLINNSQSAALAALSAIVISLYLLVVARRNKGLLIVFGYIWFTIYSSCIVNYFNMEIFSVYQQWVGTSVSRTSINIVLVFLIGIVMVMPSRIEDFPTKKLIQGGDNSNGVIVTICCLAFLLCGIFGVGQASATSDRYGITPLYEYSMVFLIAGLYFGGSKRRNVGVFLIVSAIRILLDFSIGSRVTSIAILAIWYLMIFAYKIKTRRLVLLVGVGFIVMLTVGELRGSEFTFSAISTGFLDYVKAGFAWDGAYAAYHTSQSMVAYRELTAFGLSLSDFIEYLVSLISGVSASGVELQHEMQTVFWNMGGGYFPFFFYYYTGYIGVFISSVLIGCMLRIFSKIADHGRISDIKAFAYIWICATSFRWFSYSVSPLVRGLALVACVFIAMGLIARTKLVLTRVKGNGHD